MLNIFDEYRETGESLARRVDNILSPPLAEGEKMNLFRSILGVLDMTTLEGSDTEKKIVGLCTQARFSMINSLFPDAAAVCVYPALVRYAKKATEGTLIKTASVAGGFPSGQTSLHVKCEEVKYALDEGADEIDTVISRGKLLEGSFAEVFDELSALREVCGRAHLKVILETGELLSPALVKKASELAILAGADFIKTSTGKITAGADPVNFLIMLDTIREYLEKTGKTVGIKPAGGIRQPAQALAYARILVSVLGEEVFNKEYFRIGASSLAGEILQIENLAL